LCEKQFREPQAHTVFQAGSQMAQFFENPTDSLLQRMAAELKIKD
jgi:hypothetical protein